MPIQHKSRHFELNVLNFNFNFTIFVILCMCHQIGLKLALNIFTSFLFLASNFLKQQKKNKDRNTIEKKTNCQHVQYKEKKIYNCTCQFIQQECLFVEVKNRQKFFLKRIEEGPLLKGCQSPQCRLENKTSTMHQSHIGKKQTQRENE